MEDPQIHGTIEQLVAEEHELWERESEGAAGLRLPEHARLQVDSLLSVMAALEAQLDTVDPMHEGWPCSRSNLLRPPGLR